MSHEPDTGAEGRGLEGRYANYVAVGHNAFEFVLDFGQFFDEGDEPPRPHTRIITSPIAAKTLWTTLGRSLEQYEREFHPIGDGG